MAVLEGCICFELSMGFREMSIFHCKNTKNIWNGKEVGGIICGFCGIWRSGGGMGKWHRTGF